MAKTFNLAEHLAAVAPVSNSDTQPVIKMLPVRKIFPNENNFYDTSNIDELVNSILMYGVLDPITVRPSGDGEGYIIISGHRRHSAVIKILDESLAEDTTKYQEMPCIIREPKDELLEELMLIQANSATRVLTSAEVSKQVERVERLLYELKEQGYEFPGRMRDNVAQACNVSASKIARLKVIREKLIPELNKRFEDGLIAESAAYEAARLPERTQQILAQRHKKQISNWEVNNVASWVNNLYQLENCEYGNCQCEEFDVRVGMYLDKGYCSCAGKCCMECYSLATCENSCARCSDRKAIVIADRNNRLEKERENSKRLAAQRKEEKTASDQRASKLWQRLGAAREAVGMTAEALYNDILNFGADDDGLEDFCGYERGKIDSDWLEEPFCDDVDSLRLTAAALHCTTDYLLGISDEPTPAAEAVPTWRTGVPETSGLYAAKFDCSGHVMKKLVYYDNCLKKFYFDESHGRSIEAACVGWYPVPQDKEDE